MDAPNYITDEVLALVGFEAEPVFAPHPVEPSEIRRFQHATMDPAPRYWDEGWAATSRYARPVAPPTFPMLMFRRPAESPDPLDVLFDNPDAEGLDATFRNLPRVPVPLSRRLNGGYRFTFFRYAAVGERVGRTSRYKDIYQKTGKSGPLIFIVVEDKYFGDRGGPLLNAVQTNILR